MRDGHKRGDSLGGEDSRLGRMKEFETYLWTWWMYVGCSSTPIFESLDASSSNSVLSNCFNFASFEIGICRMVTILIKRSIE